MVISYAITVCNEEKEIKNLLKVLEGNIGEHDEIVVLLDKPKCPPSLLEFLIQKSDEDIIELKFGDFKGDFSKWKNKLNSHCIGETIINLDADELPSEEFIYNIKNVLIANDGKLDLLYVPRINIVKGIGLSHVNKWRWNISKLESYISEKEFDLDKPEDLDEYNLLKQYGLIIEEEPIS